MDISSQKKGGNHVHEDRQVHKESRVEVAGDNHVPKEDTGVLQVEQKGVEHHPQ